MKLEQGRGSFALFYGTAALLTLILGLLAISQAPNFASPDAIKGGGLIYFQNAERVISTQYQADEAPFIAPSLVELPDAWDKNLPGHQGFALYRSSWQSREDGPVPNAVFIPRAVMNIEVYLNGSRIGGLGRMTGEISRNWNRPFYFEFPEELVQTDSINVIEVQVAGYADYRSGLGRFWVGPRSLLEPAYRTAYWWQVNASMVASAIALSAAVVILGGAAFFRRAGGLLYLALAVISWVIRNIGYYLDWIPMPHLLWGQFVLCLHAWFGALYGMFLLRYLNITNRGVKWASLGYGTLVSLSLFAYEMPGIKNYTLVLLTPTVPFLLALNLYLVYRCWRDADREATIIGFSSLFFLMLLIRDLSAAAGYLPFETVLLSQMTGVLLFTGCSGVVLYRYKEALEGLQSALSNVNQKLSAREDELLEQFEVIRRIQTQRTKDDERRRIMQDIHDGVGSSLVSAINLTQVRPLSQTEMREVLNDCLDDLRFAIDSLDPTSNDLLAVLGNFRWRFEKRLKTAGIKLVWNVFESPELEGYSSRQIFELLRIIQEAFGNILKHARCTEIIMTVTIVGDSEVLIMIDDNGVGLPAAEDRKDGRGLAHMQKRAKALGANLKVGVYQEKGRSGTRVELRLPIKQQ